MLGPLADPKPHPLRHAQNGHGYVESGENLGHKVKDRRPRVRFAVQGVKAVPGFFGLPRHFGVFDPQEPDRSFCG